MTTLDFATDVYLIPGNVEIDGSGNLVPGGGLGASIMDFILKVPQLEAGQAVTLHFTGSFNSNTMSIYSVLSPDAAGYSGSAYYSLRSGSGGGSFSSQTFNVTVGPGVLDFDTAIANGETYMYVTVSSGTTSATPFISGIAYDAGGGTGPDTSTFYTIPGGTTTEPGGDGVLTATVVTPLSISKPGLPGADGGLWFKLTGTGLTVPWAYISVDSTLSYDATTGISDASGPSVHLDVYRPNVAEPASVADLTLEASRTSGTADGGGTVPRGQWQFLQVYADQTVYLHLTGGVNTALILRVGEYGAHTDWDQPADQEWTTSEPASFQSSNPSGSPVIPDVAVPYARTDVGGSFGTDVYLRRVVAGAGFQGTYSINRVLGGTIPGEDAFAAKCAWEHARVGAFSGQFWSSDGTGTGDGTAPVCMALDDSGDDAGHSWVDSPAGWTYNSTGIDAVGHQSISFSVDATEVRANLSHTLSQFGATAGLDPDGFTAPDGYSWITPLFEDPLEDEPEILGIDVAPNRLDNSSVGPTIRWYLKPVSADNADLEWDGWGPKEITPLDTTWLGGNDKPEGFVAKQDVTLTADWTTLDNTLVSQALAYETAAAGVSGSGGYYLGGLRFVALFDDMLAEDAPASGMTSQSSVSNYQFVTLRLRMRPTRVRFADMSAIPAVVPGGAGIPPLRLTRRNDRFGTPSLVRSGFYAQGGNRLTGPI